jgi:uncharacterized protein YecE (DUF72 family)
MAIWVGTSGYNYPEWRGSFYPEKFPSTKMLRYYAERFATVEINYTFYRMPNEKILAGWNRETPDHFKLTLKAPKRITHDSRLRDCQQALDRFLQVAGTLGPKLGAILFQLPPYFKKDLAVLDGFLAMLPANLCATFEFRHASWLDEEVYARLKAQNLALCIADSEKASTPLQMTADYAYFVCATKDISRPTSPDGRRPFASTPRTRVKYSSTSSTKKRASDLSSRIYC